jgi:hypothetical protein
MSTTDNEIATKQKQVKPSDLRACGWLQTQFPESLWSGGILGPESGVDGHLWVKIPISDGAAATALKGAGFQKSIQELFPDAEPGKWQLHATFRKYSRGFFKVTIWISEVQLTAARKQIFLGYIAAANLRHFARDLRQMMEIGYPTFRSITDAYSGAAFIFRRLKVRRSRKAGTHPTQT